MADETVMLAREYQFTSIHFDIDCNCSPDEIYMNSCGCGAVSNRLARLEDIAERLAEAVLTKHALIESSEVLRD